MKSEVVNGIHVYHVAKIMDDEQMKKESEKGFLKRDGIKIIHHDADVYSTDNILLAKFRKSVLPKSHIDIFYENMIDFARNISRNRGTSSGSKSKNLGDNPKVMSNIFGYFDQWSASHKRMFANRGKKIPLAVRECRFNRDHPEKYKAVQPLIQDIDRLYKQLTPEHYKKQFQKAKQTHFRIADTSFTTVTTNVNYQTAIHTDKGDDPEGFGNLVVIEKGKYKGAETCFPQYGIGFNVRTGDILFMDVHQWHANLPLEIEKDAVRLSIVCYLRKKVWEHSKHKTKKFMLKHNETVRKIGKMKIN